MAETKSFPATPDPGQSWKKRLANWSTYTAAAGAAFAAASSADASIIYVNPGSPIEVGAQTVFKTFSIAGDNVRIEAYNPRANFGVADLTFRSGGQVFTTNGNHALKFTTGAAIGGPHLQDSGRLLRRYAGTAIGSFTFGVPGFEGFQTAGGDLGWIEVEVLDRNDDGYPDEAEVIAWAYNNAPGTSIEAGQGIPTTTPEPGSAALALLAVGAAGVLALRRRREIRCAENS